MKKAFIIGIITLVALFVLAAPLLVGELILRWVPAQIQALDAQASWEVNRGWRRSSVRFTLSDGTEGELHGRHLPLSPPALLAFDGRLQPAGQAAPARIHGRMALLGGLTGGGQMAEMEWWAADTHIALAGMVMALDTRRAPLAQTVSVQADRAVLADRAGNRLALADADLGLHWQRDGDIGRLALRLDARRGDRPASGLTLDVVNIALEPLARLVEAAMALRQAGENDLHRQMLMLGLLNAWQDLGAAALSAELHELALDQDYVFSGRWRFDRADETNIIQGRGGNDTLRDWLAPVLGLSTGHPPEVSALLAQDLLDQLERHGWLVSGDGRSHFRLTGRETLTPGPDERSGHP